jgi:tetratricopeptide (TPR) repeat protein
VVPRLLVVNNNSLIASAIPDGGIIISKKVLDICYMNPERGDDRLAFVLAHEIAHQLKDDFWHMKFFQAIELSKEKSPEQKKALEEVKSIAGSTENVLAKELQADEYGIVYASMAGYNTSAVVTEDDKVNFFEDWLTALDPARIPGIHKDPSHPNPKQRAETIKARLRQVLENVQVFNLGVLFYQTGEYQKAILAFQEFLKFFPSREVYHNLASSHHQLALIHYQAWKGEENAMPFKLSMAIDPSTLATKITLKGSPGTGPEEFFRENIEKAVEFYGKAISQDPSYYLSYNNLGCALILKEEPHKAVGTFKDALKIKPDLAEALNNIGVAFYYAENPAKARENLTKAHESDPSYDAPLFNLARIAQEEKNAADAKKYGEAYLRLDPDSPWADSVRTALSMERPKVTSPASAHKENENILGLETGAEIKEIPASWSKPTASSTISLEEEPFKTALYPNGIMIVSQKDEIIMIVNPERFQGKSGRGISIGSSAKEVLSSYGTPSKMLNMTQGATWVYAADRIAFRMRDRKVVSWVLF